MMFAGGVMLLAGALIIFAGALINSAGAVIILAGASINSAGALMIPLPCGWLSAGGGRAAYILMESFQPAHFFLDRNPQFMQKALMPVRPGWEKDSAAACR